MKRHSKVLLTILNPWTLLGCFIAFTLLSFILLFRDKRALEGISDFYPHLHTWLFSTRELLLQNNLNTIPTFLFALIAIVAILAYVRSLTIHISLKKTIIFALLFQLILFASYPILSTDIFSYMLSERVSTAHNESIWKVIPATFPQDPYFKLADWKETTSIYGAVHYGAYYLPSKIAGNNLLLSVILYKLVPILFAIGTGYVLYLILKQIKPHFVEKGMRLVLWNPLYVLEIAGAGHNDSIMIFFILLCMLFFIQKRWLLSGIAIAFAVHVKIIPIIVFALLGFVLFQKHQFKSLGLMTVSFIVINMVFFILMQLSPISYVERVTYNGGVYWQSLPNVLRYIFAGANTVLTVLFGAWAGYYIFSHFKKQLEPVHVYCMILLMYLLFSISAYWNWYVLWIICFVPLLSDKKLIATILVFSFTSLLAYPLLWFSLRFGFGSMIWPFVTYILVFGVPVFVYLYLKYKRKNVLSLVKE